MINTHVLAERSKQVVVMRRSQAMLLVYMFIVHKEYMKRVINRFMLIQEAEDTYLH